MIRLVKGEIPQILQRKAAVWTETIMQKVATGELLTKTDRSHYAHREIKAALITETHGKCAYCESKLRHVTHGDVEHIVPKSISPERWYDWGNLTLACDICNGNKSNYHGDHATFIDPYAVDPEEHLLFFGPMVWPKPGCEAAGITTRLLDLNRAELVERRDERLKALMKHLEVIEQANDPQLKAILQADFLREIGEDKEFAALAREFVRCARAKFGNAQAA